MAKKQLKKLNQPKKYLQGGSNMASVAQTRQNPYYIGQVNANAAEDQFQSSQDQLTQARLDAVQAQKDARESQNQQLDATVRQNTTNLVKAAATDQKNGRLGNLFSRGPLSGQAALNLSAGAQVAPMYAAPATTTVASNIGSLTPGAVEVGANLANTSTNVVSGVNAATAGVPTIAGPTGEFVTKGIASGAKGATGLSSLATAGIGAAATIGGQLIKRGTNDKSAYTFTDKERRGNVGGSALASAGTGFGIGNMLLPGVGGAIGAGIGAGVGALKARKENKAAEEEAQRLQREQAAIRGAYQGAFVNSRLTGADTGFGLNSSTNMNNQFTNQYQVAKTGGVRRYATGGATDCPPGTMYNSVTNNCDPVANTSNAETSKAKVAPESFYDSALKERQYFLDNPDSWAGDPDMTNEDGSLNFCIDCLNVDWNNPDHVKGVTSLIENGYSHGPKYNAEIYQAKLKEFGITAPKAKESHKYGGYLRNKYAVGGEVGPCPPGSIPSPGGGCVKDLSAPPTANSSLFNYYTNAVSKYGEDVAQKMLKNRRTCHPGEECWEETKIEQPNRKQFDLKSTGDASIDRLNASMFGSQGTNTDSGYIPLDDPKYNPYRRAGGVAGIQEDRRPKKVPGGQIVPIEGTDAVEFKGRSHENGGVTIDKNTEVEGGETMDQVTMNDNNKQDYIFSKYLKLGGKSFAQRHKEILKGNGSQADIQQLAAMQEKVAGRDSKQVAAYGGFHKYAEGGALCPPGYIKDSSGNCVLISDVVAEQNKISNSPTASKVDMEAAYQDYMMGKKADELRAAQNAAPSVAANATVNPGVQAPANTQPVAQTDNTVAPDGTKLPAGYVWDATLNAPVSATAMSSAAAASANKAGTATYTAPTGVTPPAATTDDGFAVQAKRATSTGAVTGTPQTPEEKEAARLAGLPRLFMGANRKVDEATGEVTAYTDKPLMGVGAMAGSRLGTATGSQEELAKVTRNSYDQAWTNKADNLYTNQKDASGGGLSSSDAIADRDKIAESNWGQKYGYKKGMSADEAKAAHGKFAQDVKSLFASNPDEMLGYFQYIVDGGDPKNTGSYLGKDAEQIRNNLKTKGFIGADGRPIAGKVVAGKTMTQYLEDQATNNAVGPIHNALGSYTAERGSTRIKLEEQKKKEVETPTQELPAKFEPCPPGTYRSGDGTCKPVGDVPQGNKISATLMAGLGQLVPVGAALANPYKIAPGIIGAPAIKGALMPRMNLNQERASAIQQNVAYKNAVVNQNAGPGALAAMQSANANTNQQMMQIAKQEQDANKQLAAEEGKLGMQASMFNAEAEQKRQMFNTEFNQGERRYRREDILGALDTGASRIAGIVKDERAFKADERLANALDETGSYDRFTILEQLNKEAKRKNSPYANTTEAERRRIAAAMHKELNPEGYVSKSEYNKLQEEKAKLQKEREEAEKKNQAKFGGARQYVSRLGELKGVRGTKAKL